MDIIKCKRNTGIVQRRGTYEDSEKHQPIHMPEQMLLLIYKRQANQWIEIGYNGGRLKRNNDGTLNNEPSSTNRNLLAIFDFPDTSEELRVGYKFQFGLFRHNQDEGERRQLRIRSWLKRNTGSSTLVFTGEDFYIQDYIHFHDRKYEGVNVFKTNYSVFTNQDWIQCLCDHELDYRVKTTFIDGGFNKSHVYLEEISRDGHLFYGS